MTTPANPPKISIPADIARIILDHRRRRLAADELRRTQQAPAPAVNSRESASAEEADHG